MFATTAKNITTAATLLLTLGGAVVSAPVSATFAARPLAQEASTKAAPIASEEGDMEPATESRVANIPLPAGARRVISTGDVKKFNQMLQEAARTKKAEDISRFEILVWTGNEAKTVLSDLSKQLKANGYTVVKMDSIESEDGRVTPLAAMRRGEKGDTIKGLWIEDKDAQGVLLWGGFAPTTAAPVKRANPTRAPKKQAAPTTKKATPKKTPMAQSASTENAAQRQAKAMKAYQDYQYTKFMGPISGQMYRSSKW